MTIRDLVPTRHDSRPAKDTRPATFAAGCFWGVEHEFRKVPGVVATAVGFMGGRVPNPSYRQVCDEDTGHAEVVHLAYDPSEVSYDQLLQLFWEIHDPTTLNRQGPDVGEQYRSAIFYHDESQKQAAIASRDRLQASGELDSPIVTEIMPAAEFYPAEDYHQQYVEKGGQAVCHFRRKRA